MINLINKNLWMFETDGGNLVNNPNSQSKLDSRLAIFTGYGTILCYVSRGSFTAWDRNPKTWEKREHQVPYAIGHMYSVEKYFHGLYKMRCWLPNWRGSWASFWLFNGLPEIDIFEHFRKDRFLTRFHLTCTYHDGPTYQDDQVICKSKCSIIPWDWQDVTFKFSWNDNEMVWMINDKIVLKISRADIAHFPDHPMQIRAGADVDDFRGKPALINPYDPFIIKEFSFEPYENLQSQL